MVWCMMVYGVTLNYNRIIVRYVMLCRVFVWCYVTVRYGTVRYGTVRYGTVWYGMVWYGMVWYGMEWNGMVWYGMEWCGMTCYVMVCVVAVSGRDPTHASLDPRCRVLEGTPA